MSTFWKRSRETVRVTTSRRSVALLSLVVFCLTASVTYWRGSQRWTPVDPRPTFAASVEVVERGGATAVGDTSAIHPNPEDRQSFSHTANTPEQAAKEAAASADRHIAERRERWKMESEAPYLAAHQELAGARQAYADATQQLETFRRALDAVQAAAQAESQSKPSAAPEATMIENPRWRELQDELTSLQTRQKELLVERTSFHPAVQDVVARMESVQEKMIGVPPRIATVNAQSPSFREPPAPTAAIRPLKGEFAARRGIAAQDQAKLAWLEAAVDRTERKCREAEAAEKRAAQARRSQPAFVVQPAQVVEHAAPPDFGWRRLIATTLATSLIMAIGFGSFAMGRSIAPAVVSGAQLEAELGMPILGVVPAAGPKLDTAAIRQGQSRLKRALVGIGLLLMCVCPILAIWGVLGI